MTAVSALPLAAAAFHLFLGVLVFARRPGRLLHQLFFAFCLAMVIANVAAFALTRPLSELAARAWSEQLLLGTILAPLLFLHTVRLLFGTPDKPTLWAAYAGAIALVACTYAAATVGGVQAVIAGSGEVRWALVAGPMGGLVPVYVMLVVAVLFLSLHTAARENVGLKRNQARYLRLGAGLAWVCAAHGFLRFSAPAGWTASWASGYLVGSTGSIALAWLMSFAFFRHRLMDLDQALARTLANSAVLAAVGSVCWVLLALGQEASFGQVSPRFSLLACGLLVGGILLYPRLSERAGSRIEKSLLEDGRGHRDAVMELSRELCLLRDTDEMVSRVARTLASRHGVASCAIYLEKGKGRYVLHGARPHGGHWPEELETGNPVAGWALSLRAPAVREEAEQAAAPLSLAAQGCVEMERHESDVVVPLVAREQFVGLMLLGPRRDARIFSRHDLELLDALAGQLAVAVLTVRLNEALARSNEVLQHSERLATIGTMAAVLAHEIRNPLVSIRTFTQLLPERYLDEEYRESFLNLALSEVDRITALVNELLSFARPATHERSPLNLDELVERVATLLDSHARKSGVSLSIETDASMPPIIADEDKINQILVNIVHNAIQACENRSKGHVTVSTGRGWINGTEAATLTISDDGCGMSEEQVEQAFEPFFTTRTEGTGLGLAIARQLVVNHCGSVTIDSTPGKGTTFTITLPVDSPALEQAADNLYAEGLIHA